jgi:hypothetical protein
MVLRSLSLNLMPDESVPCVVEPWLAHPASKAAAVMNRKSRRSIVVPSRFMDKATCVPNPSGKRFEPHQVFL